jgi:hypothetical protein
MAVLTQGNYKNVVQKDLSEHFLLGYSRKESPMGMLMSKEPADQATMVLLSLGTVGQVPVHDNEIHYDDSKQEYLKNVSEIEYSYGIRVNRRLQRNDLVGAVKDTVSQLGESFKDRFEQVGASPFENAFDTFLVGDGLSLCNAAHTSGVDDTLGTQSNTGTAVLSAATLEAVRRNMIKFKNNRGGRMFSVPDVLIIGTDNEENAWTILNSIQKVGTANNDMNFQNRRYELVVWDNYITGNKWFLAKKSLMKQYLKFYEWDAPMFFNAGEFDTITQKYAGYMSNNVASVEWRFIFGNNPS